MFFPNDQTSHSESFWANGSFSYKLSLLATLKWPVQDFNVLLFLFPTVAALPKRESSRRKAKDNSSTKMKMLAGGLGAGGSDEEDEKDIDLSDSDQDESWTPFKEKDSKEKGGKGSDDKKQSNGPRYRQVTSTLLFDSFCKIYLRTPSRWEHFSAMLWFGFP